ncbi:C40 family peptidase [Streptomyces sp. PSKA54]|uniref:C40 family peptidase n=1 Tax=Streptomyces himalayensis subsp. aureolus TaxID=2758039 RepID=A0A7W2D3Y7_9ACTN|nr:C40 family peptidase [Streptomyces himalayensis]MBA4864025.1 C40 family peptidase [Streptomyces himalayensis subsp. aureolus]
MKKTGAAIALLACGPLLLTAPVLFAASGVATAACQTGAAQSVEAAAVAEQVEDILAGGSGSDVSVPRLASPAEQIPNARVITATGLAMQIPARGQVVALATALQESGLRNLTYGDRDSVGLFQQRPSQGWGTVEEILDPVYASTKFYEGLREVSGWESLPVAQAAQAVQRSGFPDAYAKWEPLAIALQKALAPHLNSGEEGVDQNNVGTEAAPASCAGADGSTFGPIPAGAVPDGYAIPADASVTARTAIRWAMGQLGTAYQWGGSCTDAHGPDPIGRCDCSSLMQQSYRAARVTLSRTTYTQVKEGKAVSVSAIAPGDLLFTEGTAAAPGHVGMYIGEGLVIHAPRTGDVVRIVTLASWKSEILAARRVL